MGNEGDDADVKIGTIPRDKAGNEIDCGDVANYAQYINNCCKNRDAVHGQFFNMGRGWNIFGKPKLGGAWY